MTSVSVVSTEVKRSARGRFLPGSGVPPRRGRGGQAGNLNAAKDPWRSYWRRRALRKEDAWALALVSDYVPALVADKGGDVAVSFAERKVMELAAVARVCWALAMAAGNLDAVARFIGAERQALADLGLERRAKPVPTLQQLIAAQRSGHAGAHTGTGTANGASLPVLVVPGGDEAPEQ